MATPMPAVPTMAASTQRSPTSRSRFFFSSALKKSRFQTLSQSAMPTLPPVTAASPAVSSQANSR
jgi:hypothetical protein